MSAEQQNGAPAPARDLEFIPAAVVHELAARVAAARDDGLAHGPSVPPQAESAAYWEAMFEANAVAVLAALGRVHLAVGYAVRYRFYGRHGGDLLVRPFVARATTDVSAIRALIDWHPPPDTVAPALRTRPTKDVDFLYRHFTFERSARGVFEYWLAMQELWGSARWVHSRIITDAEDFAATTGRPGWSIDQPVERHAPAVVWGDDGGAHLAVLLYCPIGRETVTLQRIEIGADGALAFVDAIIVAQGPRGYRL
jgi:hypothetical protein